MKLGLLFSLAVLAIAARPAAAQEKPKGDPNLLTAAEITAASNINNAEDAIRRLRPKFLRDSGKLRATATSGDARGPVIYVDDCKECGAGNELRLISTPEIVEIKFVDAMKAMAMYGDDHRYGAIFVTTSKGQRKKP
jgi:hypothetical protein